MSIDEEEELLSSDLDSSSSYICNLVLFSPTSPFVYEGVAAGIELRICLYYYLLPLVTPPF